MAKVSETYAGAFVTGAELQPLGQHRTAVIHQVVQEMIGQENARPKIVLDLVSKQGQPWPRRVVLNKTNALMLAAAYGDDTADWPGKTIEVWGEMVNFRGKIQPGVRLAAAANGSGGNGHAPPASLPPPAASSAVDDDEIPF